MRVALIPKPCRASHHDAKDLRPISLASILLKTTKRLLDFYINGGVLTDTEIHHENIKVALCCFVDIERVFDNTDFEAAVATRERERETNVGYIKVQMLSGRSLEATVCGTSPKLEVTRGCPQGGILSPIRFSPNFVN